MAGNGYSLIDTVVSAFLVCLRAVGWGIATLVHTAWSPIERLARWAFDLVPQLATAPIAPLDGAQETPRSLGRVQVLAYERRRVARSMERDVSVGLGLRLAA